MAVPDWLPDWQKSLRSTQCWGRAPKANEMPTSHHRSSRDEGGFNEGL